MFLPLDAMSMIWLRTSSWGLVTTASKVTTLAHGTPALFSSVHHALGSLARHPLSDDAINVAHVFQPRLAR